jgi:hypothetical protein
MRVVEVEVVTGLIAFLLELVELAGVALVEHKVLLLVQHQLIVVVAVEVMEVAPDLVRVRVVQEL